MNRILAELAVLAGCLLFLAVPCVMLYTEVPR